jgi:hypothetical protein
MEHGNLQRKNHAWSLPNAVTELVLVSGFSQHALASDVKLSLSIVSKCCQTIRHEFTNPSWIPSKLSLPFLVLQFLYSSFRFRAELEQMPKQWRCSSHESESEEKG